MIIFFHIDLPANLLISQRPWTFAINNSNDCITDEIYPLVPKSAREVGSHFTSVSTDAHQVSCTEQHVLPALRATYITTLSFCGSCFMFSPAEQSSNKAGCDVEKHSWFYRSALDGQEEYSRKELGRYSLRRCEVTFLIPASWCGLMCVTRGEDGEEDIFYRLLPVFRLLLWTYFEGNSGVVFVI